MEDTKKDLPESLKAIPLKWVVPSPYGFSAATEAMGSVAAPLLAGFSLTLTLLVLQAGKGDFRWPDATVLVLVAAAVLFIMVIQFSFWARQYVVTPSELLDWWPDIETNDERAKAVFSEQRKHALLHKSWATRA